jgi:hypothetical protein
MHPLLLDGQLDEFIQCFPIADRPTVPNYTYLF